MHLKVQLLKQNYRPKTHIQKYQANQLLIMTLLYFRSLSDFPGEASKIEVEPDKESIKETFSVHLNGS